jgi:hypothetical protein
MCLILCSIIGYLDIRFKGLFLHITVFVFKTNVVHVSVTSPNVLDGTSVNICQIHLRSVV